MNEELYDQIKRDIDKYRVKLVPKKDSAFMRVLGKLAALIGNKSFMTNFWTTIGRTIYYPVGVQLPFVHVGVLEHELVHVKQWDKWGPLMSISYMLLPVPFFFAWFRWRWEREAYMTQLRRSTNKEETINWITDTLWHNYGWCWPRKWMRKWFWKHLGN